MYKHLSLKGEATIYWEEEVTEVWVPNAVITELEAGRYEGYDVPVLGRYEELKAEFEAISDGYDVPVIERYPWIESVNPRHVLSVPTHMSLPSAWIESVNPRHVPEGS